MSRDLLFQLKNHPKIDNYISQNFDTYSAIGLDISYLGLGKVFYKEI